MPPGAATALGRRPNPKSKAGGRNVLVDPRGGLGAWREGYVRRAGLVQRLLEAREASVAVIVAPPGYGKSSLLSEWAAQDERPFLWLKFDESSAERAARAKSAAAVVATVRAQERSFVLATYALCGFANFGSIAIQVGGIGSLAPERRGELAQLGLRAMLGGLLASYLTATIAGILL